MKGDRGHQRGSIPAPADLRPGSRPVDPGDYQRTPVMPGVKFRQPPVPEVTFRPPAAVAGPYQAFLEQQAGNRRVLTDAPDLRSQPRKSVDAAWNGAIADCKAKFGRAPSVETWEQPSDVATVALNHARACESDYLRLAGAPGASLASLDAALAAFCSAVASWLNEVTKGWPSRKVYDRQQAAAAEERYR